MLALDMLLTPGFALHQVAVEQQYQQLCEAWKAELDEKQRQFEQARAQILEPRCVTGTARVFQLIYSTAAVPPGSGGVLHSLSRCT